LLELDTDPKHARRQWRELLAHFDRNQEVIQRLWDERQALEQQHQALEQKHHALKQKYQELQEQHHALGSLSWALEQRCEDATIDLEQREMLHESAQRLEADRATHQLSLQFQSRLSGQHIRVLQAKLKKLQGELEQSRSQLEAGEAEAEGEKAKKAESETEKAESKARAKENVDSAYFVVMAGLYTLVGVVMVDRLHHLFTEG
jgi:predicted nuclease with TOPRIM domain